MVHIVSFKFEYRTFNSSEYFRYYCFTMCCYNAVNHPLVYEKVSSNYFSLAVLLSLTFVNLLLWWVIKMMIESVLITRTDPDNELSLIMNLILSGGLISMLLFISNRTMIDSRYIIIYEDRIVFIYLFLPFIRKTRYWSDYDYKVTVKEYIRNAKNDAVWLVKNGKLKDRISSSCYSNYEQLFSNIQLPDQGRLSINPLKMFLHWIGKRIK